MVEGFGYQLKKLDNVPVVAGGPNYSALMKVSGRPWVEENGSIVLLVRSFDIQKTLGGSQHGST